MSFDRGDIRPSMDVYTLDNSYLGTVLRIHANPITAADEQVAPDALQSSDVSGELLGPVPTLPIGNRGPRTQSAGNRYATQPDAAEPIGRGTIEVGKWWGMFGRRTISLDDVQTVSLERVVLRLRDGELGQMAR
jgi:hypothetical protein